MAGNAGLNPAQLANAQRIISIGKARGESARNIEIAIMTALTESGLQMYANSSIPSSLNYPHDAVGHDHASLGIFQQQTPGWGSVAELMDPNTDATKFYNALDAKNTAGLSEWAAAQKVQVSAYADGSNYKAQLARAQGIMQALYGSTPSGSGAPAAGAAPAPTATPALNLNPTDPNFWVQFLEQGNPLSGIVAELQAFNKIGSTLSDPKFWIRTAWFILGASILILVAVKLFNDSDTGQAINASVKNTVKSAAKDAVETAAVAA